MFLRRLLLVSLFSLLTLGASTAVADDCGSCPEEGEDEDEDGDGDGDGETAQDTGEEEDEKGCSHVMMPQNLAVFGAGLLLFVVASRRGAPKD